ncbi:hypothetical protein T265_11377 [Opisthorchis viverrini]|uniref:Uncharacterized protein n=1 Tax=Opisthorchis viverrini TaxID=6198 RepID=A0A074YYV4_OPIVI|nr:hypothetical protein T265_11377 [Opisthorchis viverrini]KER19976.1 hypothetical protein T265_11377 [Opisthorchis viverrini]
MESGPDKTCPKNKVPENGAVEMAQNCLQMTAHEQDSEWEDKQMVRKAAAYKTPGGQKRRRIPERKGYYHNNSEPCQRPRVPSTNEHARHSCETPEISVFDGVYPEMLCERWKHPRMLPCRVRLYSHLHGIKLIMQSRTRYNEQD